MGDRWARLRELEAKATEGPFFVHDFRAASCEPTVWDVTVSCDNPATITVAAMGPGLTGTADEALANAGFFAEARNQVRALLEERDELVEALRRSQAVLVGFRELCDDQDQLGYWWDLDDQAALDASDAALSRAGKQED